MIKLTTNEMKAIEATINYDNREDQKSDNFANATVKDLQKHLNWTPHQVAGLTGSLAEKGVAFIGECDLLWLTEKGIDIYFDNLEANS